MSEPTVKHLVYWKDRPHKKFQDCEIHDHHSSDGRGRWYNITIITYPRADTRNLYYWEINASKGEWGHDEKYKNAVREWFSIRKGECKREFCKHSKNITVNTTLSIGRKFWKQLNEWEFKMYSSRSDNWV